MLSRSRVVAEPRWEPNRRVGAGQLAWMRSGGGSNELAVGRTRGWWAPRVVPATEPLTGVRAYGGGVLAWAGTRGLVTVSADGRLLLVKVPGGRTRVLTGPDDGRACAPAVSPDGAMVAVVLDRAGSCDVWLVALDGRAAPRRISRDADYAFDPVWSPDGRFLAWHEWNFPNMPWDGSRIVLHDLARKRSRVVAGGDDVGVGQPRFSPDGSRLAFVSDATGFVNVWIAGRTGSGPRPLVDEPFEHAEPTWGPGQRSFAWSPDGRAIAWCRNEQGFGRLVVARVGRARVRELGRGWHQGLEWGPDGIVAVRSGAKTPPQIVVVDPDDGTRRVVDVPTDPRFAGAAAEPEPVTWRGSGGQVHGLLWCAEPSPSKRATPPPMLVWVHGGPTSQAVAGWGPRVQYFVERGWSVLQPNPRGSTGYGRRYTQALGTGWGARDVADCAAGIRHAGERGWCDPDRVAVIGGSAGGMTVYLLAALHGDLVRAGVSLYGVTDLFDLAATTHRYESRYLDRIVGVLPRHAARYRRRSPVSHAARISIPMLVLQGDADPAVPKAQADAMVDAMRTAGVTVEYRVYRGEGHGWSRPGTIRDEVKRTEAFLQRWVLS